MTSERINDHIVDITFTPAELAEAMKGFRIANCPPQPAPSSYLRSAVRHVLAKAHAESIVAEQYAARGITP